MPHAGSPLMRNHAPLADVNPERSMLGFSSEACLATLWFSNDLAAGFSLILEKVWDPCPCEGKDPLRKGYFILHTMGCMARPNTVQYVVYKDTFEGQRLM